MIASILRVTRSDIKEIKRKYSKVDAYTIHKIVYSLFPATRREFLYYDQIGTWNEQIILILSAVKPMECEFGEIECKAVPDNFLDYDLYAFQAKLNPVQAEPGKKNRSAVIGKEKMSDWLIAKSIQWGFEVSNSNLEVLDSGVECIEKKNTTIFYNCAMYKGVLRVKNRELFKESFCKGLGRGKSFGFGLLQLRPLFENS